MYGRQTYYSDRILIVGPHKTFKGLDISEPFWEGPASAVFTNWLTYLGIWHYDLSFINATSKFAKVRLAECDHIPYFCFDKVIALGNFAEAALIDQGCTNYFWLPFPDSKVTDPPNNWYIQDRLSKCKEYLRRPNEKSQNEEV